MIWKSVDGTDLLSSILVLAAVTRWLGARLMFERSWTGLHKSICTAVMSNVSLPLKLDHSIRPLAIRGVGVGFLQPWSSVHSASKNWREGKRCRAHPYFRLAKNIKGDFGSPSTRRSIDLLTYLTAISTFAKKVWLDVLKVCTIFDFTAQRSVKMSS